MNKTWFFSIYNAISVLVISSQRKMGCLSRSYQHLLLLFSLFHSQTSATLCPHHQSFASLQFKQLFSFQNTYSWKENVDCCSWDGVKCGQFYPKMMSRKEDIDCCSWDGVTCDTILGLASTFVIVGFTETSLSILASFHFLY